MTIVIVVVELDRRFYCSRVERLRGSIERETFHHICVPLFL